MDISPNNNALMDVYSSPTRYNTRQENINSKKTPSTPQPLMASLRKRTSQNKMKGADSLSSHNEVNTLPLLSRKVQEELINEGQDVKYTALKSMDLPMEMALTTMRSVSEVIEDYNARETLSRCVGESIEDEPSTEQISSGSAHKEISSKKPLEELWRQCSEIEDKQMQFRLAVQNRKKDLPTLEDEIADYRTTEDGYLKLSATNSLVSLLLEYEDSVSAVTSEPKAAILKTSLKIDEANQEFKNELARRKLKQIELSEQDMVAKRLIGEASDAAVEAALVSGGVEAQHETILSQILMEAEQDKTRQKNLNSLKAKAERAHLNSGLKVLRAIEKPVTVTYMIETEIEETKLREAVEKALSEEIEDAKVKVKTIEDLDITH